MKNWCVTPDGDHVYPLEDDFGHVLSERCICGPTLHEDGFWVHHSFDGREMYEDLPLQ